MGQVSVSSKDSLPERMKQIILETSSRLFHDPAFPRFIMADKSGKYVFGVLGYVGATAFYDGGGNAGVDFINADIDMQGRHDKDRFGITMAYTRLGFKMIGDLKAGRIVTYIETDFKGNNNGLRLRQAYIQFRGLTIGQGWSSFTDMETPTTIDGEGPPGMASNRLPQIKYKFTLPKNFSLSVALEVPEVTATYNDQVVEFKERFPDIPVVLGYDSKKLHLMAGYAVRILRYKDMERSVNQKLGRTVLFAAGYKFTSKDNIYGQFVHAAGMVDHIQDMGSGLDMIVAPDGKSYNITKGYGYCFSYQRLWDEKSESNIMFSQTFLKGTGDLYPTMYNKTNYFAVNYIRKFFTYGTAGVEFIYGTLHNNRHDVGNNFRINLLMRYDF